MNFFANLFFLGTIISAVFTITAINPVNAVVGMTSVFVNGAIYLILKTFNFIGLSYLIIYVGAIAILFLFVVMMMNIKYIELSEVAQEYTKNLPLGVTTGATLLLELFSSVIVPLDDSFTSLQAFGLYPQNGLGPLGSGLCVPVSVSDPSFGGALGSYYSFSHIESLGNTLYTYGLLWFLLGSTILLLAMIGPICLCLIKRGA